MAAVYVVLAGLLLAPISRQLDAALLRAAMVLHLSWAEMVVRERLSRRLANRGDMRGALAVRRQGVERALRRGGLPLAFFAASYGMLLQSAGWIGAGSGYLRLAEEMTRDWTGGRLRDVVVIALSDGMAMRGDVLGAEALLTSADTAANRNRGAWQASLAGARAMGRSAAGDWAGAVAEYRAALAPARLAGQRALVVALENNLAGALIRTGELEAAEQRLAAGEALAPRLSPVRAHLAGTRAELELFRGDFKTARVLLERSAQLKAEAGAEGGIGWTLATRARLEAAAGNREEAARLLAEAAGLLQNVEALTAWKAAAVAIGDRDPSATLASASDPLLEQVGDRAKPVSPRSWKIHEWTTYAVVLGLAVAALYLVGQLEPMFPGGWITLTLLFVVYVIAVFAWLLGRRVRG